MHKVFKEEWVKTMLARGKDPDAVMEKIDKHWDNRENVISMELGHHGKGRHEKKINNKNKGRHRAKR